MKKKSVRPTSLFLALAAAAGLIPNAYADWNVAVGSASANGAWSGGSPDVWTPSATGATVSAAEIGSRLGAGTPVVVRTSGGGGAEAGDIDVSTAVTWNASQLTFSAWRNIAIKAGLSASGAAQLALQYGLGAVNAGNSSDYHLSNGAKVNLPAGANFSTKLGNNVAATVWTVITDLGLEGDATVAPGTMTLQGMNTGLAGNYVLGADIPAGTTLGWNAGAGFTAVGTSAAKFTGSFDGLGHTITGLTINRPANVVANYYQGLFGYAAGALRNVGLLNSSIAGASVVGTLAGRSDGKVSNAWADGGTATASIHQAGGLLGALGSSLANSYANVSVNGTNNACCGGGVASSNMGGLVGTAAVSSSISSSYSTGSVSGGTYVGGLVGQNRANIDTSYASGAVASAGTRGGFIGDQLGGTIANSYWDSTATGMGSIGWNHGGTISSLTDVAAAPKAQASYPGLDFAGSWRIYEGNTRPLLKSFLAPLTVTANNASKVYDGLAYSGGNGVTYSTAPDANLLGTVSYGGTSQGAVNAGSYAITPYGQYSNQRGYDITFVDGVLTVIPTYAITVNAGVGGTASCTPNPVEHGGNSTCTATANLGYSFTGWSGDCTGATCVLSNVTGTKSVTAAFALNTYAITVTAGTGGTASCTPNPVSHGGSSTCSATANSGYSFSGWSGDCTGATCVLNNVTGTRSVTASFLADGVKTYTAASATGSGSITAVFSGGGVGCGYTVSQYIPLNGHAASPPLGSAPAGVGFPHGLFDFTAGGCTSGSTLTFTITYPQALAAGTQYWKYGPTPGNAAPHWYVLPATIVGNTATFSITDGGLGDDDLAANGTIVDQGGPGVEVPPAVIPTLNGGGLALLGALLALLGWAVPGRRPRS